MAKLEAEMVASDLQPNLALLKSNVSSNGEQSPFLKKKVGHPG